MRGIVALLWNPGPLVLELCRTPLPRAWVNNDEGSDAYVPETCVRRGMRMGKVDPSPILLRTSMLDE
jgi:hypothetical protein